MMMLETIFWGLAAAVFYTYIGYGIILAALVFMQRLQGNKKKVAEAGQFEPKVALVIAAYNEKECIEQKVQNSFQLDYPKEKIEIVFVTDGSSDGTPDLLKKFDGITVLHEAERKGKVAAINRVMPLITAPVTIFSDANAMLNPEAIREIVRQYRNPQVGAVAGEKRIRSPKSDKAAGAGEGIYWKYEASLKKMDAELYSVVGAAGEIFSVRTNLFETLEPDTLLDDFMISLRVAQKGYRVMYAPEAYAIESPSSSIKEELKRKVRICAGGIQSIVRLKALLNPFRYGMLAFQYVSHRVLRWSIAPLALVLMIPVSYLLMTAYGGLYTMIFFGQAAFYFLALLGWYLENKQISIKILFVPYYFFIMNLAVYLGFVRYVKGQQSVLWERAGRA
ncbi:MAG: glycosyltransferase family 2 protein [Chlorobiales bacterium]|jgi:cellulose synthase/poly-beta-1,6-N-acetylglucosamine synthase-like glycosyltransferase|nr:glycosyltransferase family 2 protein [Chlorobiales bacterium]